MSFKTWLDRPRTKVMAGCALLVIALGVAIFGPESDACGCSDPPQRQSTGAPIVTPGSTG